MAANEDELEWALAVIEPALVLGDRDGDMGLARKAADLKGMAAVEATTDALQALAGQLPTGRVFASGRAFVPFVKDGLYSELAAHLPVGGCTKGEGGAEVHRRRPQRR